ncbi:hypothetical protein PPROV_001087100 [Pycnococcus provasolii]|uniref:BEACH domain-containing protein n=1 Tax=Pycnococcus provasolii TaxID=41880 RepID=A0A830HZD9_9CHLO|nr:hypothetical protein PPROV_001087100 [Pycnococcus provasolii]
MSDDVRDSSGRTPVHGGDDDDDDDDTINCILNDFERRLGSLPEPQPHPSFREDDGRSSRVLLSLASDDNAVATLASTPATAHRLLEALTAAPTRLKPALVRLLGRIWGHAMSPAMATNAVNIATSTDVDDSTAADVATALALSLVFDANFPEVCLHCDGRVSGVLGHGSAKWPFPFDATNDASATGFTFLTWVRLSPAFGNARLLTLSAAGGGGIALRVSSDGRIGGSVANAGGNDAAEHTFARQLLPNTWYFVVFRANAAPGGESYALNLRVRAWTTTDPPVAEALSTNSAIAWAREQCCSDTDRAWSYESTTLGTSPLPPNAPLALVAAWTGPPVSGDSANQAQQEALTCRAGLTALLRGAPSEESLARLFNFGPGFHPGLATSADAHKPGNAPCVSLTNDALTREAGITHSEGGDANASHDAPNPLLVHALGNASARRAAAMELRNLAYWCYHPFDVSRDDRSVLDLSTSRDAADGKRPSRVHGGLLLGGTRVELRFSVTRALLSVTSKRSFAERMVCACLSTSRVGDAYLVARRMAAGMRVTAGIHSARMAIHEVDTSDDNASDVIAWRRGLEVLGGQHRDNGTCSNAAMECAGAAACLAATLLHSANAAATDVGEVMALVSVRRSQSSGGITGSAMGGGSGGMRSLGIPHTVAAALPACTNAHNAILLLLDIAGVWAPLDEGLSVHIASLAETVVYGIDDKAGVLRRAAAPAALLATPNLKHDENHETIQELEAAATRVACALMKGASDSITPFARLHSNCFFARAASRAFDVIGSRGTDIDKACSHAGCMLVAARILWDVGATVGDPPNGSSSNDVDEIETLRKWTDVMSTGCCISSSDATPSMPEDDSNFAALPWPSLKAFPAALSAISCSLALKYVELAGDDCNAVAELFAHVYASNAYINGDGAAGALDGCQANACALACFMYAPELLSVPIVLESALLVALGHSAVSAALGSTDNTWLRKSGNLDGAAQWDAIDVASRVGGIASVGTIHGTSNTDESPLSDADDLLPSSLDALLHPLAATSASAQLRLLEALGPLACDSKSRARLVSEPEPLVTAAVAAHARHEAGGASAHAWQSVSRCADDLLTLLCRFSLRELDGWMFVERLACECLRIANQPCVVLFATRGVHDEQNADVAAMDWGTREADCTSKAARTTLANLLSECLTFLQEEVRAEDEHAVARAAADAAILAKQSATPHSSQGQHGGFTEGSVHADVSAWMDGEDSLNAMPMRHKQVLTPTARSNALGTLFVAERSLREMLPWISQSAGDARTRACLTSYASPRHFDASVAKAAVAASDCVAAIALEVRQTPSPILPGESKEGLAGDAAALLGLRVALVGARAAACVCRNSADDEWAVLAMARCRRFAECCCGVELTDSGFEHEAAPKDAVRATAAAAVLHTEARICVQKGEEDALESPPISHQAFASSLCLRFLLRWQSQVLTFQGLPRISEDLHIEPLLAIAESSPFEDLTPSSQDVLPRSNDTLASPATQACFSSDYVKHALMTCTSGRSGHGDDSNMRQNTPSRLGKDSPAAPYVSALSAIERLGAHMSRTERRRAWVGAHVLRWFSPASSIDEEDIINTEEDSATFETPHTAIQSHESGEVESDQRTRIEEDGSGDDFYGNQVSTTPLPASPHAHDGGGTPSTARLHISARLHGVSARYASVAWASLCRADATSGQRRRAAYARRREVSQAWLDDLFAAEESTHEISTLESAGRCRIRVLTRCKKRGEMESASSSRKSALLHDEVVLHRSSATLVRAKGSHDGQYVITSHSMRFEPTDKNVQASAWPLPSIRQVHTRRYRLRRSALEVFFADRTSAFMDFESTARRSAAYRALVDDAQPPHLLHIYKESQSPAELLYRSGLTQRWCRREISNFDYLMALNTLAGRTYADPNQHPVMPWTYVDFTSETIDLEDASRFRDLSQPLGALDSSRRERFVERYESLESALAYHEKHTHASSNSPSREQLRAAFADGTGSGGGHKLGYDPVATPPFHYGSHYSSAGILCYYLIRAEPYTSVARELQGGKFDHADRLFHDIAATWHGVQTDTSDVKELVPELYTTPEVLLNGRPLDMGTTQRGETLHHVKLPPWAKGSAHIFCSTMMAALESEIVSSQLHMWIDIIFGFKQRGDAAINALNVFHPLTYEGMVDVDSISDEHERQGVLDQILHFGQTPSQLLTQPHPRRCRQAEAVGTIFQNPSKARPYTLSAPCLSSSVPAASLMPMRLSVICASLASPGSEISSANGASHAEAQGHASVAADAASKASVAAGSARSAAVEVSKVQDDAAAHDALRVVAAATADSAAAAIVAATAVAAAPAAAALVPALAPESGASGPKTSTLVLGGLLGWLGALPRDETQSAQLHDDATCYFRWRRHALLPFLKHPLVLQHTFQANAPDGRGQPYTFQEHAFSPRIPAMALRSVGGGGGGAQSSNSTARALGIGRVFGRPRAVSDGAPPLLSRSLELAHRRGSGASAASMLSWSSDSSGGFASAMLNAMTNLGSVKQRPDGAVATSTDVSATKFTGSAQQMREMKCESYSADDPLRTPPFPPESAPCVLVSNGRFLIVGGFPDGSLRAHDLRARGAENSGGEGTRAISSFVSMAFGGDGAKMASHALPRVLRGGHSSAVTALGVSPCGRVLISGDAMGVVCTWLLKPPEGWTRATHPWRMLNAAATSGSEGLAARAADVARAAAAAAAAAAARANIVASAATTASGDAVDECDLSDSLAATLSPRATQRPRGHSISGRATDMLSRAAAVASSAIVGDGGDMRAMRAAAAAAAFSDTGDGGSGATVPKKLVGPRDGPSAALEAVATSLRLGTRLRACHDDDAVPWMRDVEVLKNASNVSAQASSGTSLSTMVPNKATSATTSPPPTSMQTSSSSVTAQTANDTARAAYRAMDAAAAAANAASAVAAAPETAGSGVFAYYRFEPVALGPIQVHRGLAGPVASVSVDADVDVVVASARRHVPSSNGDDSTEWYTNQGSSSSGFVAWSLAEGEVLRSDADGSLYGAERLCVCANGYVVGYVPNPTDSQRETFSRASQRDLMGSDDTGGGGGGVLACIPINGASYAAHISESSQTRLDFGLAVPVPPGVSVSALTPSRDGRHVAVGFCSNSDTSTDRQNIPACVPPSLAEVRHVPDLYACSSLGAERAPSPDASEEDKWSPGLGVADLILAGDATNVITVNTDGGVTCHTDPAVSLKIVDQMLRLGWSEM